MVLPFLYPTLLPLTVALVTLIIALTYVGGKVFNIPQWEAYLSVELYSLVMAIFFISILYVGLYGSESIARALLCDAQKNVDPNFQPTNCDPISLSQLFLNKIINRGVMPMYKDLLTIEAGASLSNSFMIRVGPGVWSSVHKVEPGADAILAIARLLSFGLLTIYGSLSVQYMALSFISFGAPIALSIGILLYVFPPTREAGVYLVCLAFGFLVVFPFTYALNERILEDISMARTGNPYEAYVPEMFGLRVRGAGVVSFLVPLASIANFELLIPFINAMAHLSLVTLFMPGLSMMLTISMISSLSKFLLGKT